MSFSFIQGPQGQGMTGGDLLSSSLDQPMSAGSTFWESMQEGARESFGAGTLYRNLTTPEAAPPTDGGIGDAIGAISNAISPDGLIRRALGTDYNGQEVMNEGQYKASPYARPNIPYQQGMTADRAAALAETDDMRQVRQFYGAKRPVTSFFGNLAGAAVDPINYIPVAGEVVQAANVARFGRLAGTAITSSLDAAANTALAGVATIPLRGSFGDDVSFESTISQIGMAALVGGAFGAIKGSGVVGRGVDAIRQRFGRDVPAELRADAEAKLATLQNVQQSRVALNDALDGMINRGEVEMSPASADFVARVADQELPKVAIARMAREADPAAFERLDNLSRTFDINQAEISRLLSQSMDNERYGRTRGQMIEADRLAEKLQKAEDAIQTAPNEKQRGVATQRRDDARQVLRDHLAGIDDNLVQEIEQVDASLAARRAANEPVAAERSQLQDRATALNEKARNDFWSRRFSEPRQSNGPVETTRFYYGSADPSHDVTTQDDLWVSPDPVYAKDYRAGPDGNELWYVDVPNDRLGALGIRDEINGYNIIGKLPKEWAGRARRLNDGGIAGQSDGIAVQSRPNVAPDPSIDQAAVRVGKPEANRAAAEQYRVNPETGDFPELGEIEQLRAEGRLTEDDLAALDDADETIKTANAYGEALKSFANCVI